VTADPAVPATLERRLGPIDAAAVVVSNVIGSGILILPAIIAMMVPSPWAMLGVWATGGLLAFAGAMAYAELAALRPRAGGEYVYLREAFGLFGPFVGNIVTIVTMVIVTGSISAMVFAGPRVYYAMACFSQARPACIPYGARPPHRSLPRPCGPACSSSPARSNS
jgi:APA family basic amino acid/polyamine antiporter